MGVMTMDIEYQLDSDQDPRVQLLIRARLGYRERGDPPNAWKELDQGFIHRSLDCDINDDHKKEG